MDIPLENLKVADLLEIARKMNLSRYSKLRKTELICLIRESIIAQQLAGTTVPTPQVVKNDKCYGKVCIPSKICNPSSGICVNRDGAIGKLLVKPESFTPYVPPFTLPYAPPAGKCATKVCVSSKICNPESGRCVNRDGDKGKKIINDILNAKICEPDWYIYTMDGCNYCKKAKDLLDSLGLKYTESEVNKVDKEEFFRVKASETKGYKYFPVIYNKGVFIGGFTELQKMLSKPTSSSGSSSFHMFKPQLVQTTKFRGQPWEDLVSMLYLMHKHKNDCVAIPLDLMTNSGNLTKKALGVTSFNDTSLSWSTTNKKFNVPKGLWDAVRACLKRKARFIVMPLGINAPGASHANFLIYNSETKSLERFEPHGMVPETSSLNIPELEEELGNLFNRNISRDMVDEVFAPVCFCPAVNVQAIQVAENQKKFEDAEGFCVAWAAWYADVRLSNPKKSRSEVISIAIEKLRKNTYSFTQFIRSYASFLTRVGDQLKTATNPARVFTTYLKNCA
ncbi:MAG: hypothetical protein EBZ58_13000 [Bacteroidetes bacterium]|nr:hypothetical protein [Bacteroidota bacterium]